MNLIEIAKNLQENERLTSGHRLCPGCAEPINIKLVLSAIKDPLVVINTTSCLEVATTIYPYTAWKTPWIHNAFENSSATASGVIEAYLAILKKKPADRPKWAKNMPNNVKFLVVGGDGGTADIGLQSLSGALERRHQFLYVCYDNEAYMNTGNQRSGATPRGADTTTTPVGKVSQGKKEIRKDLTAIVEGHHINYVAQSALSNFADLTEKVKKAIAVEGPSFINLISPCQRSWGFDPSQAVQISKMAVETNFWPLYEIDHGKFILNYVPKERVPLVEWFKMQKRFKHLLKPENKDLLDELQKETDEKFAKLQKRAEFGY
ncbi:MAG: thiamine pyrophosphate-dependent enzyme [Candidatus Pacebacteria bacterium]|jgi:pyruvate ferredoxin oxidoreductase beta subunit|nr:thiamine pyrophosphate-dependent enzyme [Candidatus Paceibacterota bacterium]